jgi:hypothetical protein
LYRVVTGGFFDVGLDFVLMDAFDGMLRLFVQRLERSASPNTHASGLVENVA